MVSEGSEVCNTCGEPLKKFLRYHPPTRSEVPPGNHVLVFDGDCSFCRASVEFVQRNSKVTMVLIPFTELSKTGLLYQLGPAEVAASSHYITPEGQEYHGGEAMIRAFQQVPGGRILGIFHLWGLNFVREITYSLVANNRRSFSRLTRPIWERRRFSACPSRCVTKTKSSNR